MAGKANKKAPARAAASEAGQVRWGRSDNEGRHSRVYMRGDEPIIELSAAAGAGRTVETQQWGVLARWRIAGEGRWVSHSWECRSEAEALALLDAVAIGIVAVIGPAQMVEVGK